jgi:hypothetical protein
MNLEKKTHWWQEPMALMVFALPMIAVIAGLTTVWIAYSRAPELVNDNYSKDLGVEQTNEMDKRAHFLGVAADLKADGGMLTIDLTGKLNKPQHLLLKLIHPTGSNSDIVMALTLDHAQMYSTVLPSIPAGERKLVVEPVDRKWRLTGSWEAPFSGTLHLTAKAVSDSSMLP